MLNAREAERRATAAEQTANGLLGTVTAAKKDVIDNLRDADRSNIARALSLLQGPQTEEARRLADITWASAHKVLGDDDPVTWAAADVRARVALAQNHPGDAERILGGVADGVRRHAYVAPPDAGQYFVHLADAVERQGRREDVERLLGEAIRYYGFERERGRPPSGSGGCWSRKAGWPRPSPFTKPPVTASASPTPTSPTFAIPTSLDAVNRYRAP